MRSSHSLISIIIPMYNDAVNVPLIYKALSDVAKGLQPYEFEFVFVNDGSEDVTTGLLVSLHLEDPRVRVLEFSRNFGKEAAVSAGMRSVDGAAVIIIDSDLQHPPQLIGQFIAKWEAGAEVVVGIRQYSDKVSWFKRQSSAWYYRFLSTVSQTTITPNATDFRLLDRCVVDAFNEFTEHNRMTRGLIDWLGFRRAYVDFVAPPRRRGESTYSYSKLVGLAVNSFTAYSVFPLRLAGYAGLFILLISAPAGLFIVVEKYILNDPMHLHVTGTAFLAIILLFLVGIVLACLGLIALYIAQIHAEVVNRPLYMLRKRPWRRSENPATTAERELLSEALDDNTDPVSPGTIDDSEAS